MKRNSRGDCKSSGARASRPQQHAASPARPPIRRRFDFSGPLHPGRAHSAAGFCSRLPILALLAALLAGCATSNVESRKKERYDAYSALPTEQRAAVDAGQIKMGMTMDAVYIAWGKPHQIVGGETPAGAQVVWLYSGTQLQGYTYWGYRGIGPYCGVYRHSYYGPMLYHDYVPVGYVKAEVIFENGVVKQWRTLPAPAY